MAVATVNRDLATLRRMLRLASEWGAISRGAIKVRLLAGENRRGRVLAPEEEQAYLAVASPLLHDVAVILFDCGLRPEECYRLKSESVRDAGIHLFTGKTAAARRRVPATSRVLAILEMRLASAANGWLVSGRNQERAHRGI
jgi:integrase